MRTQVMWVAALAVPASANRVCAGTPTAQKVDGEGAVAARSGRLLGSTEKS